MTTPTKLAHAHLERVAVALALAVAGCSSGGREQGGGSGAGSGAPPTFPGDPLTTTPTDTGSLRIDVRTSPQPPVRGTIGVELAITNAADGTPVDGLTLDVKPWMPSMGHGSAVPSVTAEGAGKYLVTDVYLYMPGLWQLQTKLSGPVADNATPSFDVP
jgi:hypothetical protein